MARSYHVQTFGCQMNEHDSERIAGLLEADGMERAGGLETADVIVFNTCCIRESADNKLYGELGHLKALKADNPDLQIAVGGCLAQKDRELIRERAGHVDVVFGTHNVGRAVALLDQARTTGPVIEILEAATSEDAAEFPSALPARRETDYAAWLTIQIGCDNSSAFCIVPAVRGPEISRPFADLLAEARQVAADGAIEITLLGQNVNSYGRDLTLGLRSTDSSAEDERQAGAIWASDDRRRPRALFADLLREVGAVEGISRVRYTSPHPKDIRPDVLHTMAETPTVCEHLHLPLQSGSDAILAAMHRGYSAERYLERLREAREIVPDLAVTTDIIVGFPGETDADFEATLEVAAEAQYDSAFTFVFSPRPGTEAAEMVDRFCDHDVVVARYERLREVVGRSGMRHHEARVGRLEEVIVEGPSKRDNSLVTGRTRQNKLVHFKPMSPIRIGTVAMVSITASASHYLHGELVDVVAAPRHKTAYPRGGSLSDAAERRPVLAIVGVTASGKSALAMELARRWGSAELISVDSMQVYQGMDIGTAKPTAAEQAAVRHHMIDIVHPTEEYTVGRFQRDAAAAIADVEARNALPILVGGTGLHLRAVVDDLEIPPRYPEVQAGLEAAPTGMLYQRLAEADPVSSQRMEPTNRRRIMRALTVTIGSGRPFSSFGAGMTEYGPTRFVMMGPRRERHEIDARITARYETQMADGFLAEVRALTDSNAPLSKTARQALGYRQLLEYLAGETSLNAALADAIARTRQFARRQDRWFRRDPRIRWFDVSGNSMQTVDAMMREWELCT